MSKLSSSSFAVLLCDGYDLIPSAVQNHSVKKTSPSVPTHGLGSTYKAYCPTGVQEAAITQDGAFFDDTTNGIHDAFKSMPTTARVLSWATAGNTIGAQFTGAEGTLNLSYDVAGKVADLTKANVQYAVSGRIDNGVVLQHQTAKTADWNTKSLSASVDYTLDTSQLVIPISSATKANPCVVTTTVPHGLTTGQIVLTSGNTLSGPSINSEQAVTVISTTTFSVAVNTTASTGAGTGGTFIRSSTVAGGAGYQQIAAFSGFTGFVGKIRHSVDDSTYADLIAFTNVTSGPTAERKTVSGTVNRYLCFDGDVTGSGSITPFAGFARW